MLSWSRFHADACSQVPRDFSAPLRQRKMP